MLSELKQLDNGMFVLIIGGAKDLLQEIQKMIEDKRIYRTNIFQKQEQQDNVKFLRRWCSFYMNSFLKYLKVNNKQKLHQQLLDIRNKRPSKQHKFEQGDLRNLLIREDQLGRDFKKQWLEFLTSEFLVDFIKKNKKIQPHHKRKYLDIKEAIIMQSLSKDPFYKFMSTNNSQETRNISEIDISGESYDNNRQQLSGEFCSIQDSTWCNESSFLISRLNPIYRQQ